MAILPVGDRTRLSPSIFLLIVIILFQKSMCFMDMEELKSVYYGLHILKEPVPLNQDTPQGAVHVTSKYGQQYQCTFPDHSSEEKRKEEEEKLAMETGIVEILKPMGNSPCLFKAKDWWSYEFCFGKYIRQFHVEDGEVKGNIIYLGYYQDDFDWDNETSREARLKGSKSGQGRYHSQNYTLGTKCDLTGQMRRAEVRFICEENSEDYLSRVDESETCVYTVTVATSRICPHPYLKAPARRKPVPITCNPLLSKDQFESYMQDVQEAKVLEQQRLFEADNAKRTKKAQESAELRSLERLFSDVDGQEMEKDEFEKVFGQDEALWKSYMKFLERRKINKHVGSQQTPKDEEQSEEISAVKADSDPAAKTEKDEDDEIISEFNDEIQEIKSKFDSSQKSISKIKRRLGWEKKWENEIEDAIREAERELGVKVDRSLISGLSDTLDKLVGKLAETENELVSASEEVDKLKPGQTVLTTKDADSDREDEEGKEKVEKDAPSTLQTEASNPPTDKLQEAVDTSDITIQAPPKIGGSKPLSPLSANTEPNIGGAESPVNSDTSQQQQPQTQGDPRPAADMTVQAPPKTGSEPAQQDSSHHPDRPLTMEEEEGTQSSQGQTTAGDSSNNVEKVSAPVGDAAQQKTTKEDDDDDAPELTITLRAIDEDEEGNSKNQLPDKVQKLLEESLKREYKKNKLDSDPQPLTFDADHSFQRDKTVHVIQSEDDDGKTSRYIFVFGFNSQTDEMAEHERQSELEDSYGFVYKGNKNKKTSPGA